MELSDTANYLVLAGRILFVTVFLLSGIGHLAARAQMTGYAASKGLPAAALAVPLTGLMLIASALGVLLGVWIDLAFLLAVIFLLPTAVLMHAFWKESDPMMKMAEQVNFNKNVSLAGGALILFALTASMGDGIAYTLTGPLFSF